MRHALATVAIAAALAACAAPAQSEDPSKPEAAEPTPKAAAAEPAPPGPLAGFGWFAELAGSCWKGAYSDGQTTDTQCYLPQYGRLMRGSIRIMRPESTQPAFEGDAVFAIDPAGGNRLVFTQWGTGGVYARGEVTFEGETLVFRNRQADGTESPVRSIWRRTGPDGFHVARERSTEKGWLPLLDVEYRRVR